MAFRGLMKKWYATEAIPLYVVMAAAIGGASWYSWRLARGPDIIWDHRPGGNNEPWNNVQQGQQTKLLAVNQEYPAGKYKRDKW